MENYSNGNVGYCEYLEHTRGITINWHNNIVSSVECEHELCGYADSCPLYQQLPVGYQMN